MDHFLAPNCGQYRLNSSEIIEIHGGETAQVLHWDDVIWPAHFWAPDRLLQFNYGGRLLYRVQWGDTLEVINGIIKREVKPNEIVGQ